MLAVIEIEIGLSDLLGLFDLCAVALFATYGL